MALLVFNRIGRRYRERKLAVIAIINSEISANNILQEPITRIETDLENEIKKLRSALELSQRGIRRLGLLDQFTIDLAAMVLHHPTLQVDSETTIGIGVLPLHSLDGLHGHEFKSILRINNSILEARLGYLTSFLRPIRELKYDLLEFTNCSSGAMKEIAGPSPHSTNKLLQIGAAIGIVISLMVANITKSRWALLAVPIVSMLTYAFVRFREMKSRLVSIAYIESKNLGTRLDKAPDLLNTVQQNYHGAIYLSSQGVDLFIEQLRQLLSNVQSP